MTPSPNWSQRPMQTGYSRFPVTEGDLDETIGLVHVKQAFELPHRCTPGPGWATWRSRGGGAVDTGRRRVDVADPGERPADGVGRRRVRRYRRNGDRRGPRSRRSSATSATSMTNRLLTCERVGAGWRVSGLLRIDEVADRHGVSAATRASTRPSAAWSCTSSGTSPPKVNRWSSRHSSLKRSPEDPMRWRATVAKMDGRRIDLLDLVELGPRK